MLSSEILVSPRLSIKHLCYYLATEMNIDVGSTQVQLTADSEPHDRMSSLTIGELGSNLIFQFDSCSENKYVEPTTYLQLCGAPISIEVPDVEMGNQDEEDEIRRAI